MDLLPKDRPLILVVNKIDHLKDQGRADGVSAEAAAAHAFTEIVPVSAKQGSNLDELLRPCNPICRRIRRCSARTISPTRPNAVLAAELIREKLFRLCGEEIPYAIAVTLDKFEEEGNLRRIFATILVDRDSQKAIVIGKGGEKLKPSPPRRGRTWSSLRQQGVPGSLGQGQRRLGRRRPRAEVARDGLISSTKGTKEREADRKNAQRNIRE